VPFAAVKKFPNLFFNFLLFFSSGSGDSILGFPVTARLSFYPDFPLMVCLLLLVGYVLFPSTAKKDVSSQDFSDFPTPFSLCFLFLRCPGSCIFHATHSTFYELFVSSVSPKPPFPPLLLVFHVCPSIGGFIAIFFARLMNPVVFNDVQFFFFSAGEASYLDAFVDILRLQ